MEIYTYPKSQNPIQARILQQEKKWFVYDNLNILSARTEFVYLFFICPIRFKTISWNKNQN